MNNALAINEGAEDALLRAMVKPLFIKRRQTQRPKDCGSPPSGGQNEDTRFKGRTVFSSRFLLSCHISNNEIHYVVKIVVCLQLD